MYALLHPECQVYADASAADADADACGKKGALDVKASVGRGGPIFGFNERLWDLFHLKRPSVRQACSRHPQPQIG